MTCDLCKGSGRHAHFPARRCGACNGTGTRRATVAAVVLIDTDDPLLQGLGTVEQQWTALHEAVAGGGITKVVACMSERDAGAMLYAYDHTKKLIGEPLAAAPSGHSPRRQ